MLIRRMFRMEDRDEELERRAQEEVQRGIADLNRMATSLSPEHKSTPDCVPMQALGEKTALKVVVRDGKSGSIGSSGSGQDPEADNGDCGSLRDVSALPSESSYILLIQVIFPFTVAGIGMVLAGVVLDYVQTWNLFKEVPEIYILVPSLLGLKGNLEMTLASRLSTLANLGLLSTPAQRRNVVASNMALIQVQATVVAFLASAFAMLLAWIPNGKLDTSHMSLLCAASVATACSASFLLSLLMSFVVISSRSLGINPDNVATPIAASLGDLTTLGVLSLFGSLFLHAHQSESWLNIGIIVFFLILAPIWLRIAVRDDSSMEVLRHGWMPVICSMLISSGGGFILEKAVRQYPKIAAFQPVINGVGGNLVAVQASRLSTSYHLMGSPLGQLPNGWRVRRFLSIKRAFFSKEWDSRSARVLLFLVVPGHMFFNWMIRLLQFTALVPPSGPLFTSFYLCAAITQVVVLLYVCQWLVSFVWSRGLDPDNTCIPYLTALGDLLGTSLLFVTFAIVDHIEPELV